jgi:hypothetical protein
MAAFKTWLEKSIGSAGIDQSPTDTAAQTNAIVSDFFANSPKGGEDLSSLTRAGDDNSRLHTLVPDIASRMINWAGPRARRAGISPMDTIPHIGTELWDKNQQPTFFRSFARMLKKMKK